MRKYLALALVFILLPWQAFAARTYTLGFELQSVTAGVEFNEVTGSPTIDTTTKCSGDASLKIASLGSGTRKGVLHRFQDNSNVQFFYRKKLRIVTAPTANNTIFKDMNSTTGFTTAASVGLKLSPNLEILLFNGTTQIGTSTALNLNQCHTIEIRRDQTPAAGSEVLDLRIDGVSVVSSTALTIADFEIAAWGGNLLAETQTQGEWYFDDIAFNDTAGTSQNSWAGAGSVVHMKPNAAGDNSSGTLGGTSPAATVWESLDEVTPNDGTDFVAFTNTADIADVNLETSANAGIGANDTITLVQVGLRLNATSAAAANSRLRIKSQAAGTVATGTLTDTAVTAWNVHDDNALTRLYKLTRYTDPQAGGAWTPALLDTMQIGIETTDVTPNPQFSTLWALVEYVPAAAATSTPTRRIRGRGITR